MQLLLLPLSLLTSNTLLSTKHSNTLTPILPSASQTKFHTHTTHQTNYHSLCYDLYLSTYQTKHEATRPASCSVQAVGPGGAPQASTGYQTEQPISSHNVTVVRRLLTPCSDSGHFTYRPGKLALLRVVAYETSNEFD